MAFARLVSDSATQSETKESPALKAIPLDYFPAKVIMNL